MEYQNWLSEMKLGTLQKICFQSIMVDHLIVTLLGIRYDVGQGNKPQIPHRHDFFELHYITEGEIVTNTDGVANKYKPNEYYLMPPYVMHYHSHENPPNYDHVGLALRWKFERTSNAYTNPEINRMVNILNNAMTTSVQDEGQTIIHMLQKMIEMSEQENTQTEQKLLFVSFLMALTRVYAIQQRSYMNKVTPSKAGQKILNAAIEYIELNCASSLTVEEIAQNVHISYSHLSRLFTKYTFDSINDYIIRVRIDRAQRMLLTSDATISNIAKQVGFSSVSYFSNTFKKRNGMSPKQYRMTYDKYYTGVYTQM